LSFADKQRYLLLATYIIIKRLENGDVVNKLTYRKLCQIVYLFLREFEKMFEYMYFCYVRFKFCTTLLNL